MGFGKIFRTLLQNLAKLNPMKTISIILGSFGLVVFDGIFCKLFAQTLGEGLIILSLATLAVTCGSVACQHLMKR